MKRFPHRWFDYSSQTTDAAKQTDAIENIRYYFAHVFNDVSTISFPALKFIDSEPLCLKVWIYFVQFLENIIFHNHTQMS